MASRTLLSEFGARLDILLLGIPTTDLSAINRKVTIRHAVQEYNRYLAKREVAEWAGSGDNYYMMFGNVIAVVESKRDQAIDLQQSGTTTDEQISVKFTLAQPRDIYQLDFYLMRTGATVAGTATAALYTADSNGLPDKLIDTSETVEIDGEDGCRRGIFRWVGCHFDTPILDLPAGDYCAVLATDGYTYVSGTCEVNIGVDQSSVTNNVGTYNGTIWAAYGTDSEGIIRVKGCVPGWQDGLARIIEVEYPACDISNNEQPQVLDPDDYYMYTSKDGAWLYMPYYAASTAEDIRMRYAKPYVWVEATDPIIDTPEIHFEAICNLAAALSCEWLATLYGQNSDGAFVADSVNTQDQDVDYQRQAEIFRRAYMVLTGLDKIGGLPALEFMDVDFPGNRRAGFIFHSDRDR